MTQPQRALQANSRGVAVLITAVVVGFLLLTQVGASGGGSSNDATPPEPDVTVDEDDEVTTTTDLDADDTDQGDDTDEGDEPADDDGTDDEGDGTDEGDEPAAGEVRVAVLNGSGVTGLAADTMNKVADAGYAEGPTGNAAATETTAIYYREGFQAQADALASYFGLSSDVVAALSSPFDGTTDDDVVIVVLGTDFQS